MPLGFRVIVYAAIVTETLITFAFVSMSIYSCCFLIIIIILFAAKYFELMQDS